MVTRLTLANPALDDQIPLAGIQLADAVAHTPTTDAWDRGQQRGMQVADVSTWTRGFTILGLNLTSQIVTVTLRGCSSVLDQPYPGIPAGWEDSFDVTITIPAGGSAAQTYTPSSTGWLPRIWCQVQAAGAPAAVAGVTVLAVREQ